ncbi:MAG: T9SS type A sorting domain-containing protein [Bacteroidales bacterium]
MKKNELSLVTTINTEKLNDGIYFIKIIFNNNTIITKKISVI